MRFAMSSKGILQVQDMKGELGSISKKGFDVKLGYGMRSRSPRVAQDTSFMIDTMMQSCWANVPPELLREVLMRIEASDDRWPPRKNVVACAGVCKSWREIIKEIVKSPQVSGTLTFPISLKQPGPKGSLLQCFIKRRRRIHKERYYLFLGSSTADGNSKFLLAARKCRRPTCTEYIISLNSENVSKGNSAFVGKLRSNFLGTKFTIYDAQPTNPKCHSTRFVNMKRVCHIAYDLNVVGSRGLRRMKCSVIWDAFPAPTVEPRGEALTQTVFLDSNLDSNPSLPFVRENVQSVQRSGQNEGMLVLRNKAPMWREELQSWCLHFSERVTVASVRNFQLVASPENGVGAGPEHENVILEFGRVGKGVFIMDYQYPISAFQAFAICLSSFDTKIAYCEY